MEAGVRHCRAPARPLYQLRAAPRPAGPLCRTLRGTCTATALRSPCQAPPRDRTRMSDVLVLCYHAVSEHWPADLAVFPDRLDVQLRYLVARGYRGATFTTAVVDRPYRRTLAVTFDDAYASVLELGFPILERLGLPGTVYVPTSF